MNTQELTNIVDKLKSYNIDKDAYFGFFEYDGRPDEPYIKANKEGLIRYAIQLLEAGLAASTQEYISGDKKFFSLYNNDWTSENSEFYFSYIELFQESKTEIEPFKEHIETWSEKLTSYTIGGILIFIILTIVIGFISIIRWMF